MTSKMVTHENKNMKNLSISYINKKIKNQFSSDIELAISDTILHKEYKNQHSYKKREKALNTILRKYKIDETTRDKIINDYSSELVSPGLKGVIRGKTFNILVKKHLEKIYSLNKDYLLVFEKTHPKYPTSQIPDWYLEHIPSNKIIIGMNQVDLWNGGAQRVRGAYYMEQSLNNIGTFKFVCVIANYIEIKTEKSYVYNLFNIGFQIGTLCYLNKLEQTITSVFFQ